jgi:hypothetical protein
LGKNYPILVKPLLGKAGVLVVALMTQVLGEREDFLRVQ